MTFLVAEAGASTLRKLLPWGIAGLVILGLGAALWIQTERLGTAQSALKTMTSDRDLQKASAEGWQVASQQRDKIIADQAAQLTRMAADKRNADSVAAQIEQTQTDAIQTLNNQLSQLKAKANAHPDQVRPLGPIVNDVLDGMCGKAGSADPATACN